MVNELRYGAVTGKLGQKKAASPGRRVAAIGYARADCAGVAKDEVSTADLQYSYPSALAHALWVARYVGRLRNGGSRDVVIERAWRAIGLWYEILRSSSAATNRQSRGYYTIKKNCSHSNYVVRSAPHPFLFQLR